MSFNIIPPCPSDQTTKIDWQFPNQTLKTNDQGDDYYLDRVIPSNGARLTVAITAKLTFGIPDEPSQIDVNYVSDPNNSIQVRRANWVIKFPVPFTTGYLTPVIANRLIRWNRTVSPAQPIYEPKVVQYAYYFTGYRNSTGSLTINKSAVFNYSQSSSGWIESIEILSVADEWLGSNRLESAGISILKNGLVIQADSGISQPIVTWNCIGQGCPPGTCQVDCGNVYCCYGSNGIAVSSFSK